MREYIFPVVFFIKFEEIFQKKYLSETDGKIWPDSFAISGLMYENFSIILFILIFPHAIALQFLSVKFLVPNRFKQTNLTDTVYIL